MRPSLSVIIVAHDRRKFLPKAVQSVLSQSVSMDSFEVLVIKNFSDEEYDAYLLKNGIKVLLTAEESLGSKLILGIKHSNGSIVSFLEDDDLFLKNKVDSVIRKFTNPNLVFYHNSYSVINEKGIAVDASLPYLRRPCIKRNLRIKDRDLKLGMLINMVHKGGFFNLSCISVKKSLLSNNIEKLLGINVAVDNFIFWLSVDSYQEIAIEDEVLTQYRVHESNNSLSMVKNRDQFYANKIEFFKKDIMGFQAIRSVIKHDLVRKYLSCRSLIPEIALSVLDHKKVHMINVWTSLLCSVKIRSVTLFLLILLYVSSKAFPNIGILLMYNYENNRINKINP